MIDYESRTCDHVFTGGIEVTYTRIRRGFRTHCEIECELNEPKPFYFAMSLVSTLGCRLLSPSTDDVPAYYHLFDPKASVSIVSTGHIPIYEPDIAAWLPRLRSVFSPVDYFDSLDLEEPIQPDLLHIRNELLLSTIRNHDWKRVRLELTYSDGNDEQGWICRFFLDMMDTNGARRYFETRNPSAFIRRLENIRLKSCSGNPGGRSLLVSLFPDREEWLIGPYPIGTSSPSVDAPMTLFAAPGDVDE